MVTEEGIVQEILNTKAIVLIQRSSCCAGCESKASCRPSESKEMTVEALNDLNAEVGDYVQISVPAGSLLKISFLVYFVPILALVIGAVAGDQLGPSVHLDSTFAAILFGALAMAITFGAVKWFDRGANFKTSYWPRITRILPPPDCDPRACSK